MVGFKKSTKLLIVSLIGLVVLYYNGCSKPVGSERETLQATVGGNPHNETVIYKFAPFDGNGITNLVLCLDDLDLVGSNNVLISRELEAVSLSSLGTDLGEANIPAGIYVRVDIEVEGDCPSGKSVEVTNAHGSFSSVEEINLSFVGEFNTVDGLPLLLQFDKIAAKLKDVKSDAEIKPALQSGTGDLD